MLDSLKGFSPRNLPALQYFNTPAGTRLARQALVVLGTLVLAYFLGRTPSLIYLYVPVVLVAVWAVYTHPELGVIGLVVAALVIPFEIGTNTNSPLNAAFVAVPTLGFFWLLEMARNRSIQFAPSSTTLPLIGLVLTISLSFLVGYLPWNVFATLAPLRAQMGAWAIFTFSALAFFLGANRLRSVIWLKRLVWVFLALGGIYILGRLAGSLGYPILNLYTFASTGSLFWIWLVVLAAGQAIFNHDLAPRWRFVLGLLVVLTMTVALTGTSRNWASGWVPPLIGLGVLAAFRWPRLVLVAGFLAAVVVLLDAPLIQKIIIDYKAYDLLTRGAALNIILQIVQANPLLGVGPANYYYYTPLYPILGYYVRFNSHNNYIDILAQAGLLGLFFFAWWALATARVGWRLRNAFDDGFRRAYVLGCLAGLAACLVTAALGDWFLPFVYNIGINGFRASVIGWLFLGGLVALEQMARPAAGSAEVAANS